MTHLMADNATQLNINTLQAIYSLALELEREFFDANEVIYNNVYGMYHVDEEGNDFTIDPAYKDYNEDWTREDEVNYFTKLFHRDWNKRIIDKAKELQPEVNTFYLKPFLK